MRYQPFGAGNRREARYASPHHQTTSGTVFTISDNLPSGFEASARVLFNKVDYASGGSATLVFDGYTEAFGGTPRAHVWSTPRYRSSTGWTVAFNASNANSYGFDAEAYEIEMYQTGFDMFWTPLRFPGQYYDAETELHENWNRYYDPNTGRYLQPEPLLIHPNYTTSMAKRGVATPVYSYASNNPAKFVDPNGLGVIDSLVGGFMYASGLVSPGATVGVRWTSDNVLPWSMPILTVENHPLMPAGTTTTFGNVVSSSGTINGPTWDHEVQHFNQWQVSQFLPWPLSESYIPAHLACQAQSYVRTGDYASANPLEAGPTSTPPRPWP